MVAFVEGDPDQPVIVGTVYNNQQMPPYLGDGPDDKHKVDPNISGIKTNSTKGGDGFNELRFDDTKDKEQVFIHAEKDMDVRVKNEQRTQVVGDRYLIVGDENNDDDIGYYQQLVHKTWRTKTKRHLVDKVEGDKFLTVGLGEDDGGNLHQLRRERPQGTDRRRPSLHGRRRQLGEGGRTPVDYRRTGWTPRSNRWRPSKSARCCTSRG